MLIFIFHSIVECPVQSSWKHASLMIESGLHIRKIFASCRHVEKITCWMQRLDMDNHLTLQREGDTLIGLKYFTLVWYAFTAFGMRQSCISYTSQVRMKDVHSQWRISETSKFTGIMSSGSWDLGEWYAYAVMCYWDVRNVMTACEVYFHQQL